MAEKAHTPWKDYYGFVAYVGPPRRGEPQFGEVYQYAGPMMVNDPSEKTGWIWIGDDPLARLVHHEHLVREEEWAAWRVEKAKEQLALAIEDIANRLGVHVKLGWFPKFAPR